jgi:hypothetical protein
MVIGGREGLNFALIGLTVDDSSSNESFQAGSSRGESAVCWESSGRLAVKRRRAAQATAPPGSLSGG